MKLKLPKETLRDLLGFHYSRRDMVYAFLDSIRPEDFARPMNVGLGSIRGTLVHCLVAERFWLHRLRGQQPSMEVDYSQLPDVASVRAMAATVRRETEDYVAGLSDADLATEVTTSYSNGAPFSFTVGTALLHVTLHDVHHRGQVMALARQLGYEPPELDLL